MIISNNKSDIYLSKNFNNTKLIPYLFLHGFTGSHASWEGIYRKIDHPYIVIDIPGHGKSSFNDLDYDYSIDDWCDDFDEILDSLKVDKLNICGYSMGGRLAIAYASKNPRRIKTLFLESTSLGINDNKAREERYLDDLKLCEGITNDLAEFIQKWEKNPLFLKQGERNKQEFLKQKEDRMKYDPIQLSKALRTFSQGKMRSYEDEFLNFKFPIMIINGKEDHKYLKIGKNMRDVCKFSVQYTIPNCGHNTHLEAPRVFIDLITSVSEPHERCRVCDDVIMY